MKRSKKAQLRRECFMKKVALLLDFVQITPPNLDHLYNFFECQNVDLSEIQNDSLFKILLK